MRSLPSYQRLRASSAQPTIPSNSIRSPDSVTSQPLQVELPSGETDFTQCGFTHITMKAAPGSAETAAFETSAVFVDPVEKKEQAEPRAEDSFGFFGREDDGPTLRARPFRATVSSTWSSKDKEPQISVSFGWVGREREM